MTQTLTITRGLPASGKSTWARSQVNADTIRINRDDLRYEMFQAYRLSGQREDQVTVEQERRVASALSSGKNVIIDDTNLHPITVARWRSFAERHNGKVQFHIKTFDTPPEECIRRDAERKSRGERATGAAIIQGMVERRFRNGALPRVPRYMSAPIPVAPAPHERKNAVIFDVDGTLCDVRSVRHHVRPAPGKKKRNFHAFHMNSAYCPPNPEVAEMARQVHEHGLEVVVVTAREERYRVLTERWLDANGIHYDAIYTRPYNDSRPDYEVKRDILTRVRTYHNPIHAVDDNPAVLQLWREEKINHTLVPGFDDDDVSASIIPIENPIRGGRCLRCGRKMNRDGVLGPDCEKTV